MYDPASANRLFLSTAACLSRTNPSADDWWAAAESLSSQLAPIPLPGPSQNHDSIECSVPYLARELARVAWNLPCHPSRMPACYHGLPWGMLTTINEGRIRELWPEATDAERHAWLCDSSRFCKMTGEERQRRFDHQFNMDHPWTQHPAMWLCRELYEPVLRIGSDVAPMFHWMKANGRLWLRNDCPVRSRAVALWLLEKKAWPGWTRPARALSQPHYAPHERPLLHWDLIDEVWDADLVNGSKTSPDHVFRTVVERRASAEEQALREASQPFPAMPWPAGVGIRQLMTGLELVEEGKRLEHCVASYAGAARRGECFIVRLPGSTAELSPSGMLIQHRGRANRTPDDSDRMLMEAWMKRNDGPGAQIRERLLAKHTASTRTAP